LTSTAIAQSPDIKTKVYPLMKVNNDRLAFLNDQNNNMDLSTIRQKAVLYQNVRKKQKLCKFI